MENLKVIYVKQSKIIQNSNTENNMNIIHGKLFNKNRTFILKKWIKNIMIFLLKENLESGRKLMSTKTIFQLLESEIEFLTRNKLRESHLNLKNNFIRKNYYFLLLDMVDISKMQRVKIFTEKTLKKLFKLPRN